MPSENKNQFILSLAGNLCPKMPRVSQSLCTKCLKIDQESQWIATFFGTCLQLSRSMDRHLCFHLRAENGSRSLHELV